MSGEAAEVAEGTADLVNRLAQELAQLQRSVAGLHRKLASSTRSLEMRTQELSEARNSVSLLLATLDYTDDGLVAVSRYGRCVHCNTRFATMWQLPHEKLSQINEPALLALQLPLVREPERFLALCESQRAQVEQERRWSLALVDGRVLDCHSRPQRVRGRVVGTVTSYRDAAA